MCIRDRLNQRAAELIASHRPPETDPVVLRELDALERSWACLLYTSDAADERSSVDLGGRRIIKKKRQNYADYEQRRLHYRAHSS